MISQGDLSRINPRLEEWLRVRSRWMWFFGLGTALVLVGAFAIAAAFLTTLTTVLVFGLLLLVGGAVESVSAVVAGSQKGVITHLVVGVIHLVVGALMVEHPVRAAEGLTLMLAAAFLVGGLIRIGYALTQSFEGRGWALVTGVIAACFGLSIWQQWPESGLWAVGLFIGIDILLIGWSWVALGLALRALRSAATGSEDRAHATALGAK
jgi:uncharacterized membrane protein HdeD (DUF308 family)